tara:strand:+ start:161 stop:541 length:381 start_codon:yes stop_codon:yes gene_type:complete
MKANFLKLTTYLVIFTLVLMAIQYGVLFSFEVELFYAVWQIYLFHFSLAFITCSLLLYFSFLDKSKAGFVFIVCSLLKMLATVVFLLPMMLRLKTDMFANIMMVLLPYLVYLIFETIYVNKLLNSK